MRITLLSAAISAGIVNLATGLPVVPSEPRAESSIEEEGWRPPKITVSRETTYVDGPLSEDGYVDYLGALNRHHRRGVTLENNAVVLFCQALGPGAVPGEHRDSFFEQLGIPCPPEEGKYFVSLVDYVAERESELTDELVPFQFSDFRVLVMRLSV